MGKIYEEGNEYKVERKLAEIKIEMKKILANIAIRMILFVMVLLAVVFNSGSGIGYILTVVLLFLTLVFALFPLIHVKDVLVYYENKIVLKNKQITFDHPSEIQWSREKTYIMGTRLKICNSKVMQSQSFLECMFGSSKTIDVTYMKDAKDVFIRCYLNQ